MRIGTAVRVARGDVQLTSGASCARLAASQHPRCGILSGMPRGSDHQLPPPKEPSGPYRVCFVCLGNICRSPMAEVVLRARLAAAGLDGRVVVDSAGTGDWHVGDRMHRGSRTELAARGYDGSEHLARQFRPAWLAERDLILAMDRSNLGTLRAMAGGPDPERRIRLFSEAAGLGKADVPDPYGGNGEEFARVLDMLESGMTSLVDQLRNLLETRAAGR
jgi:protein-tyrosine phosphatase